MTQPDRPGGRGHKLRPTPVKQVALELAIPVYEPPSLRAFAGELAAHAYDVFVLASYGRILPPELLSVPRLGALNVHPSLLPKYRGATPIQTALLNGDAETGVSIMLMDAGLDTGDIVLQKRTAIGPAERYGELHDRLADLGAQAVAHALESARNGELPREPQRGLPIVTRPLRKDDLAIDWSRSAAEIVNRVRAYGPAPAARATIAGVPLKVLRAAVGADVSSVAVPGEIAGIIGDAVRVGCGDGIVDLLEIVAPNRAPQTGASLAKMLAAKRR